MSQEYDAENPFDEEKLNPFEDKEEEGSFSPPTDQGAPPPTLPPKERKETAPPPSLPPKSSTSSSSSSTADPRLKDKVDRLRKKEDDLNKREAMLDSRTTILVEREKTLANPREPNWPRCKPLLYHNIEEDMPTTQVQRVVRFAYFGWLGFLVALLWNFVCMFALIIAEGAVGDFVLSIVYIIVLTPLFFLIYRILYRAGRKTKPSLYIVFWIFYFLELLFFAFFVLGYPGTGAGGIFWMSQEFSNAQNVIGFLLLASLILWGVILGWGIFVFILSRFEYKKAGGLAQAKKEAATAAIEEAKEHPELLKEGAKAGAKYAAENPELVAKGAKHAV